MSTKMFWPNRKAGVNEYVAAFKLSDVEVGKIVKRSLLSAALVAGVGLAVPVSAQIPVTDVASITQSVTNEVQTLAQMAQQLTQLQNQLQQAQQQYAALTGTRDLGAIFNNPQFASYLPSNWQQVYQSMRSGGYAGLSGSSAQSAYQQNQIYDSCSHIQASDMQLACQTHAVKPTVDETNEQAAFADAAARLDQIQSLMNTINQTSDPKGIAEIQARIQTETTAINNEMTKIQLYKMIADAEKQVEEQQQNEMHARNWGATGGINVEPVDFTGSGNGN